MPNVTQQQIHLVNNIVNDKNEIWLPFFDNPKYHISSLGRVYSTITGKMIKTSVNSRPYEYASLRHPHKTYPVHRLVALTFIPNPNNYPEINHKDLNKHNNKVSNLEWCTRRQNVTHAMICGVLNKYNRYYILSEDDKTEIIKLSGWNLAPRKISTQLEINYNIVYNFLISYKSGNKKAS
jgi:hypothetical protein